MYAASRVCHGSSCQIILCYTSSRYQPLRIFRQTERGSQRRHPSGRFRRPRPPLRLPSHQRHGVVGVRAVVAALRNLGHAMASGGVACDSEHTSGSRHARIAQAPLELDLTPPPTARNLKVPSRRAFKIERGACCASGAHLRSSVTNGRSGRSSASAPRWCTRSYCATF